MQCIPGPLSSPFASKRDYPSKVRCAKLNREVLLESHARAVDCRVPPQCGASRTTVPIPSPGDRLPRQWDEAGKSEKKDGEGRNHLFTIGNEPCIRHYQRFRAGTFATGRSRIVALIFYAIVFLPPLGAFVRVSLGPVVRLPRSSPRPALQLVTFSLLLAPSSLGHFPTSACFTAVYIDR